MSDADLVSRILLNFGDATPALVVVFMLVRWVWPDLKAVLLEWLKVRQALGQQPDPVAGSLASLNEHVVSLVATVNLLVGEVRLALMTGRAAAFTSPGVPVSPTDAALPPSPAASPTPVGGVAS